MLDSLLEQRGKAVFGEDAEIRILHTEKIQQGKNGKYKITSYEVD